MSRSVTLLLVAALVAPAAAQQPQQPQAGNLPDPAAMARLSGDTLRTRSTSRRPTSAC